MMINKTSKQNNAGDGQSYVTGCDAATHIWKSRYTPRKGTLRPRTGHEAPEGEYR
jgi:hypothetical protein